MEQETVCSSELPSIKELVTAGPYVETVTASWTGDMSVLDGRSFKEKKIRIL